MMTTAPCERCEGHGTDSALAKRVIKAIEQNKGEFERLLSQIVHDQERLAYE